MIKKLLKKILRKEKIVIKPIIVEKEHYAILEGHVALVTGGATGIGFGIAKALVNAGCKVIIAGRTESKLKSVSSLIGCEYIVMNVCNIKETTEKLQRLYTDCPIDILVNSAGIHGNDKFGMVTEETFDTVINTNVKALYFLSQTISNLMIKNEVRGHILNLSSASALKPSWTPYEISKRAVEGITQGMAHKLIQHGIVVNAIAPGPTATAMLRDNGDLSWPCNPSGRMSTVEEIASLALYMVSPLGDAIVGDTFYITGGSGTVNKNE